MGVGFSNSLSHDWVQVLCNSKYSLLFYLLLRLNWQPPEDFTQKHFPTKRLYPLRHQHKTPEEGWRAYHPKHCEYNNEKDNGLYIIHDKNDQKFRQCCTPYIMDSPSSINTSQRGVHSCWSRPTWHNHV